MIDNNTLNQLTRSQRASRLFRENARIPSEVLHEARGFRDIGEMRRSEYPTTPLVLSYLTQVMAQVPADDTKLVDLYANRGNADPLVVACALEGQHIDSQYLDAPDWVVVSGDKALRAMAQEFGLQVLANAEFAALIEAAERDHEPGGERGDGTAARVGDI